MICNERQYKITLNQLEKFKAALDGLSQPEDSDWLQVANKNALKSQISDLESQLSEYSMLKEGKARYSLSADLSSLPRVLIQARIGKGWSQKDLAETLSVPPQQIQRYESSDYMGASLSRLIEVASVLGVSIKETWSGSNSVDGNSVFIWEGESNVEWNKFPIREMIKRGWINLKHQVSAVDAVKEYFSHAAGPEYATALHRKKFHGGNSPNEYALLAWQARVLEKARYQVFSGKVSGFEYNDNWVEELKGLSVKDDAPVKVKEYLAKKGIVLVIEEHLSGTYLDGAAMMLETGNPVVALTLRYDRLDNFWFVLMHELGHVFLHLFDSLNMDFFDEGDIAEDDALEKEADEFSLNSLISPEQWDLCLSRFSMSRESVLNDAENLGIHPSIIAGRIRKENSNYTILGELLGQGCVRKLFGETNS
ncbi:XRE family transcriptional regulator [Alcanivorax sp.]|uniref:helix-turn-helix domain-containing protein n=1 Tax=Alcanivorax sp. TaxID=1872427 RepID=UPI002B26748E|nr:XRE family transcriptional regulator [Alcanivorax sp.]